MRPNNALTRRSGLPWEKRHMHEIGSFALGRISAPIVASRRRHAFMADHLLHRRQVGAGVEQLGDVGAAHVVRCERGHASRRCPIAQDNSHPLIRQSPFADPTTANRSAKQRARISATHLQPRIERCYRPGRRVDPPILIALAGPHDDRAGLWLIVGHIQPGNF